MGKNGEKGKKHKGKGKNSASEVAILAGSTITPSIVSQLGRSPVKYRESPRETMTWTTRKSRNLTLGTSSQQSETSKRTTLENDGTVRKEWYVVHVWVDNRADELVCSMQHDWIEVRPTRDPNLETSTGHKLNTVGMDGTSGSYVKSVRSRDTMSVGKCCSNGNGRCATFIA